MKKLLSLVAVLLSLAVRPACGQWQDVAATVVVGMAVGLDVGLTVACRNQALCHEANPIAAMFYDPRRPAYLVGASAFAVAGTVILGHELRHSRHRALRAVWWTPAAAMTVGSLIQWRSNARLIRQCGEVCR